MPHAPSPNVLSVAQILLPLMEGMQLECETPFRVNGNLHTDPGWAREPMVAQEVILPTVVQLQKPHASSANCAWVAHHGAPVGESNAVQLE